MEDLQALRDRLTPVEAEQAAAQLPRELKEGWRAGDTRDRKPIKRHRKEFYERVRRQAELRNVREARLLTIGVFGALKAQLLPGEADDILAQLPRDLKEIWEEACGAGAGVAVPPGTGPSAACQRMTRNCLRGYG